VKRKTLKELDSLLGQRRVAKARVAGRRKMEAMLLAELPST
jgi:hypothetical protein